MGGRTKGGISTWTVRSVLRERFPKRNDLYSTCEAGNRREEFCENEPHRYERDDVFDRLLAQYSTAVYPLAPLKTSNGRGSSAVAAVYSVR